MSESKFQAFLDVIKNFGNRNVLSPLVALCVIISLPSIYYLSRDDISGGAFWFLVIIASIPVVGTITGFFVLLFTSKEDLGSEDYRLKMKEISLRSRLKTLNVASI